MVAVMEGKNEVPTEGFIRHSQPVGVHQVEVATHSLKGGQGTRYYIPDFIDSSTAPGIEPALIRW